MATMDKLCRVLETVKAELQYHYDMNDCMHRGSDYCRTLSTIFEIVDAVERRYCAGVVKSEAA